MDLEVSDSMRAVQEVARNFAERDLRPLVMRYD
jgi:hypothetical protein